MNKLILVFVAIAFTIGAHAQSGSTNGKTSPQGMNNTQNQNLQNNPQDLNNKQKQNLQTNPQDMNNTHKQNMQNNPGANSHPDGVIMQNGKMMKVKNGQMTSIDQDMTMSNGTKIMSDGTCIKKDGTKINMKEGQHMDMSGNMISKKNNKENNMYLVPDSTRKKIN